MAAPPARPWRLLIVPAAMLLLAAARMSNPPGRLAPLLAIFIVETLELYTKLPRPERSRVARAALAALPLLPTVNVPAVTRSVPASVIEAYVFWASTLPKPLTV